MTLENEAESLRKHLFGNHPAPFGAVGVGKDCFHVYIFTTKRKWKGRPEPKVWEGKPVHWSFNMDPMRAGRSWRL